jgi:hypothetical protein
MTDKKVDDEKVYKILVYGIEMKGLNAPSEKINARTYELNFEPFNTNKRFNEFDCVVLFQGIFEKMEYEKSWLSIEPDTLLINYNKNELDRRSKEAKLLFEKNGFICVILCQKFIDRSGYGDRSHTDFAKRILNISSFYRENYRQRITHIREVRSEFKRFLEIYGAANSHFVNHNNSIEIKPIAKINSDLVGMIINDKIFIVPSLIPNNEDEFIVEYFKLLADSITSSANKLIFELPAWTNEFKFSEESNLIKKKKKLVDDLQQIDNQIDQFEKYKRILLLSGDYLVEAVEDVLLNGFGLKYVSVDEFKEDLKILDEDNEPIIFCEIKGVNAGVKREFINQADSHRERANLPSVFPSLLIINTAIKKARNITEKDQDVAGEQIIHAKKMNVLILRTLDLLRLLSLFLGNQLSKTDILKLLTENSGWLKVSEDGNYKIVED